MRIKPTYMDSMLASFSKGQKVGNLHASNQESSWLEFKVVSKSLFMFGVRSVQPHGSLF